MNVSLPWYCIRHSMPSLLLILRSDGLAILPPYDSPPLTDLPKEEDCFLGWPIIFPSFLLLGSLAWGVHSGGWRVYGSRVCPCESCDNKGRGDKVGKIKLFTRNMVEGMKRPSTIFLIFSTIYTKFLCFCHSVSILLHIYCIYAYIFYLQTFDSWFLAEIFTQLTSGVDFFQGASLATGRRVKKKKRKIIGASKSCNLLSSSVKIAVTLNNSKLLLLTVVFKGKD